MTEPEKIHRFTYFKS